ncbi:MAG: glutamate-5-semialdehyde dehydrogenase [Gammaproteobacteria bacterium]
MKDSKDISSYMDSLGKEAKKSSRLISLLSSEKKNSLLATFSRLIDKNRSEILKANYKDLDKANSQGIEEALIDRLELNDSRINGILSGISSIIDLPDPIGQIEDLKPTPSGIRVSQMSVPLGVIGIIYESRPNVTADAAALCLKSGNTCILKGGSEALSTNLSIAKSLSEALNKEGLPESSAQLVNTLNRGAVKELLKMNKWLDVIIPRGGKGLVKLISDEAKVPVIKHLDGNCHVYIDKYCDKEKAVAISLNAKTYRYGICGSMETLLIHEELASDILPILFKEFTEKGVELRGCLKTISHIGVIEAKEEDWTKEYLAPILSIKVISNIQLAIDHINTYGSSHSDSIVTEDADRASLFIRNVDSSSVMHNLPTCWADGFEYGLGAEVGISTDKFHARGPVGLEGLTCKKYVVKGNAELRSES